MTTSIIVAKDCDQSGISDSYDVTAERLASANYYASPSVELRNAGRLIRFVAPWPSSCSTATPGALLQSTPIITAGKSGSGPFVSRNGKEAWSFAAPAEIHNAIVDLLPAPVRQRIVEHVNSDLVKIEPAKLASHFRSLRQI